MHRLCYGMLEVINYDQRNLCKEDAFRVGLEGGECQEENRFKNYLVI